MNLKYIWGIFFLSSLYINLYAQTGELPFVVDSLYDLNQAETSGLQPIPEAETITIFAPNERQNKYNHGVVLYPFKGMLYAQWQTSAKDEDSKDTHVYYSISSDGKKWSSPFPLTRTSESEYTTSGGWWSTKDSLFAFINVWPDSVSPKGGYTDYMSSADGLNWSKRKAVTNIYGGVVKGIIEQDLHALPSGRIITAFHMQPGLIVNPYYTDDSSGVRGWKAGKIDLLASDKPEVSRELEPAWFIRRDEVIVMVFRDQESTFKKLVSVSDDNGETWKTPMLTDMPDSRAKQSAGNLPNGTAYMVNNPSGSKQRFPLAITLSKDGYHFNKAYLIRSGGNDLQPLRHKGLYKRPGYSYPKSVIWGDYLYIAYATNKEDIQITRIPISSIQQ